MKIIKKALILLTVLWLFTQVGPLAEAETLDVASGSIPYTHITFLGGDCPEEVEKALEQCGLSEYSCYGGAMYRLPVQEVDELEEADNDRYMPSTLVLIALEKEGERILVFLRQGQYGLWTAENLGTKALLTGREFTIGVKNTRGPAYASWEMGLSPWLDDYDVLHETQFVISYPTPEGGTESYGFGDDDGIVAIRSYERVDSTGKGIAIMSDYGYRVMELPVTDIYGGLFGKDNEWYESDGVNIPYAPMWPSYMREIAEDSARLDDARQMARESLSSFEGKNMAVISESYTTPRLREKPTADSKFLGWLSNGLPVEVLGQLSGEYRDGWEWYHVRVGRVTGWTIAVDEKLNEKNKATALCSTPVLVARATGNLSLMESPDPDSSVLKEFPRDTMMHVLTRRDDGWLAVMVPRNEISWFVDMEGISGYVRMDDVLMGGDEFYPAYVPIWPSYMNDITDYPTSREEARQIADASWLPFQGKDIAFSTGARLRAKPTTDSQSLGMMSAGIPMEVLGQTPNVDPELSEVGVWYHVRVGRQMGWMYGTYVKFPLKDGKNAAGWHSPVPVARAKDSLPLVKTPDFDGSVLEDLPRDATMHVLGERADGWLYVTVPRQKIDWVIDMEGMCGYVRKDRVSVAKSVITPMYNIAALEAARAEALRKVEFAKRQYSGANLAICNDYLNLRLLPTTTKGPSLGMIYPGTLMDVLWTFTNPSNALDEWSFVRIGQQTGWVFSKYITLSKDDVSFRKVLWRKNLPIAQADQVWPLRKSPDSKAEILTELPKNTEIHILMEHKNGWFYVMVPRGPISWTMDMDGTLGYIHIDDVVDDYLPFADEGDKFRKISENAWMQFGETNAAASYGAELRDKPDASGESLGTVHLGAIMSVIKKSTGIAGPWYYVNIGQENGWVPGESVKLPVEFDFGDMLLNAAIPTARTTQAIQLRESPKEMAQSVAQLPKDTNLDILVERPDGWLYVMTSQRKTNGSSDVGSIGGYVRVDGVTQNPSR